jgi:hypothetical protein
MKLRSLCLSAAVVILLSATVAPAHAVPLTQEERDKQAQAAVDKRFAPVTDKLDSQAEALQGLQDNMAAAQDSKGADFVDPTSTATYTSTSTSANIALDLLQDKNIRPFGVTTSLAPANPKPTDPAYAVFNPDYKVEAPTYTKLTAATALPANGGVNQAALDAYKNEATAVSKGQDTALSSMVDANTNDTKLEKGQESLQVIADKVDLPIDAADIAAGNAAACSHNSQNIEQLCN